MIVAISPARAYENGPEKHPAWSGTEASVAETAQMKVARTGQSISGTAVK
jgi:hypothetical protein